MKNIVQWTAQWASGSGISLEFHKEVTSTNTLARDKILGEKRLVLTEHQTQGRGRGANSWLDVQPGTTLLSSWCFPMNQAMQPIASPLIGLALFEAVASVWPDLSWSLKAPNDLYLTNKKVAGLLIENVSSGSEHQLIVGLGFNVFSHPKLDSAGSLQASMSEPLTQNAWCRFLDLFWSNLQRTLPEGLQKTLTPSHCRRLKAALNNSPMLISKYDDVLPDGSLRQGAQLISWIDL
jgi:BirA family transcriptional regulator, biotin operon repressor / biotin---[acetyl-CoA-carboxylase] ligase